MIRSPLHVGIPPRRARRMCARTLADDLNRRFGTDYTGDCLYLTAAGAAAALCVPGELPG